MTLSTSAHPRPLLLVPALLLAFGLSLHLGARVFERLPRLEDEMAELFQARVFASGRLYVPSPPAAESFAVPFVLDLDGRRFSKYPPGHAALLAAGVWLGDPWIINPLLGVIGLALTGRLARRLAGRRAAAWAVWLGALSPFYLMTAGTPMQHAASLALGTAFLLGLLRSRPDRPGLDLATGLALGLAALVRPFTALLLSLPAAGFYLLRQLFPPPGRRPAAPSLALQRLLRVGAGAAAAAALLPLYNYALSGQLRLDLYTLYRPYDRPGFGPEFGPSGFTAAKMLADTGRALLQLAHDLHGWPYLSLLLPLVGLLAGRRRRETWLLAALPAALAGGFMLYYGTSRLYGPRYYSEALPALLALSGAGAAWLWDRLRRPALRLPIAAGLLAVSVGLYLPFRFNLLRALYDGALLDQPVARVSAQAAPPAIVFVFADNWPEAAAFTLANPLDLSAPVIFARYLGPDPYARARAAHPGRAAYFYRDGALAPASDPPPNWTPQWPREPPAK